MTAITTKVELSGNLFTHDPGKTLYGNIRAMLEALAEEMDEKVTAQIRAREGSMPYSVGWTSDHVVGYTTSAKTGKHWALWAAVGIPNVGFTKAEAQRTFAAASSVERRFHPFRNVKSGVYRARAVLSADLAKNLN